MPTIQLRWKQQARQMTFLRAIGLSHPWEGGGPKPPAAKVIGYGGAAGGGKSDALLMGAIIACISFPGAKIGYFRQTYTQLEGPGGAIMRSQELLKPTGIARYSGQQHRWIFKNDSILQFCHLEHERDVYNYQSQQFDVLMFDEATQFTISKVRYMMTRLRATVNGVVPFVAMATNPGNIGHAWFKAQYVNAGEPEQVHEVEVEEGMFESHMFIPAKLSDNTVLEDRDPHYRKNLQNQPEVIRRQLLDGDWDVADGVAFPEWRASVHVCSPFAIPDEWTRYRALDWGYAKPYAVGWYAVDFDGRIYKYRELYAWGGKPDSGTREDPEDVARKILDLEKGEKIRYAVADDAIFGSRQDNSPTIADQFTRAGVYWQPVGKGPGSRISGKLEVHHRLKVPEDGQLPMLVIFNNCRHTIRTLPNLILDENNPEDVNSAQEDHLYDQLRYAMMANPMASKPRKKELTRVQKHKMKLIQGGKDDRDRRRIM